MNRLSHSVLKEIGFTLLAEGKTLKVKAEGYSMYPAIRPGSVVYIEPFGDGNWPVPGEIIAWKKESGFVVHRFVRVSGEEGEELQFITRGDSCLYEDDPVTFDWLAGRVVRVENPDGKKVPFHPVILKPNHRLNRFRVKMNGYLKRAVRLLRREIR